MFEQTNISGQAIELLTDSAFAMRHTPALNYIVWLDLGVTRAGVPYAATSILHLHVCEGQQPTPRRGTPEDAKIKLTAHTIDVSFGL